MKNHKFKYIEEKIYLVKCKKTGGEFSTKLWDNEFILRNVCPCCKEVIKK